MGLDNAGNISRGLIEGGTSPDTPAAVISKGSHPDQKVFVTTVGKLEDTIKTQHAETPGIIVVGSVVELRAVLGDLA